jgi:hypothetical protein
MNERFLNAKSQFDSARGYYLLINIRLEGLAMVDRFGPIAPTGQKMDQTLSRAREEKVTIALFLGHLFCRGVNGRHVGKSSTISL